MGVDKCDSGNELRLTCDICNYIGVDRCDNGNVLRLTDVIVVMALGLTDVIVVMT